MNKAKISLRQFRFGFSPRKSLTPPFDLEWSAGQVAFVIGPNGSGKTTFLRSLCGLQNGLSPKVGQETAAKTLQPQDVAFFPSHWDLDPSLSIGDLESLFARRLDKGRFELLRQKWWSRYDPNKKIGHLSSGERQKVLLGMVLACDTRIFVLDEPQNFLEPATAIDLLEIFEKLRQAGSLVICASHDLSWCARVPDARCLLFKGPAVLPRSGSLTEVLRSLDFQEVFRVRAHFWHDGQSDPGVTFTKV